MEFLKPSAVRYIKLGPGGAWLDRCLAEGLIELGYSAVPHDTAAAGAWHLAEEALVADGRSAGKAKSFIREVRDFYTQGNDCLWITIGQGRLWWAFADSTVFPLTGPDRGARQRRTVGGWSDRSLTGERLDLARLSTRLTKVAAYQQTICQVSEPEYLLRRLNGVEDPLVSRGHAAAQALTAAAHELIQALDWRDFELMVDLIYAASGWRRQSAADMPVDLDVVGRVQKCRVSLHAIHQSAQKLGVAHIATRDAVGT